MSTTGTNTQDFPLWAKTRLLERKMTITELARRLHRHRSTVSTAIHNERRFPRIRERIQKLLSQ